MNKIAKILSVEYTGEWKHPMGKITLHYHKLKLDNGDEGNYGAKTKHPYNIVAGNTVEYTIDEAKKIKILKHESPAAVRTKAEKESESSVATHKLVPSSGRHISEFIGYVWGYAKDLVIAGKTMADMGEMDKIVKRIYSRIGTQLENPNSPAVVEKLEKNNSTKKETQAPIKKNTPIKKEKAKKNSEIKKSPKKYLRKKETPVHIVADTEGGKFNLFGSQLES